MCFALSNNYNEALLELMFDHFQALFYFSDVIQTELKLLNMVFSFEQLLKRFSPDRNYNLKLSEIIAYNCINCSWEEREKQLMYYENLRSSKVLFEADLANIVAFYQTLLVQIFEKKDHEIWFSKFEKQMNDIINYLIRLFHYRLLSCECIKTFTELIELQPSFSKTFVSRIFEVIILIVKHYHIF